MNLFGGTGVQQRRRVLGVLGLVVCMTTAVTGVVDVTIVSKYQFFDESAHTWLYCYYTGSEINKNGYRFGVEVNTGSGTRFTGRRNSGGVEGARSVKIQASAGDFRVGAFSCQVRDGSQTEKAITFKMKSQADVWPVTFTVTANTGDPVTLQMVQKSGRTGTLVWRKGGVLTGQNGLNFTIASVQSSDEGIYECYYQGDTDRKQGVMRLIVRGCAENKWGPPSCNGDCSVCYNGGVCDDNRGECVCPPGFYGQNCENACASNQIGTSCTKECEGGDCTGQLLCVMDPYGCSCAPGLMGIECNTVCPDGMYGAGCTQTCHCADGGSVCDVMTGVCSSGGCEAGWKGDNCQTECPDGLYGAGCTQTCHCANGPAACDKKTGACTGGCLEFWTGDSCQIVSVFFKDLFTKEEGRFFGDLPDNIAAYNDIDADECARRCLHGHGGHDGVSPPCLSFNHRPAGSPEGASARCWLRKSDKDTTESPGSEWDSHPHRNYYQRKNITADVLMPQDCADTFALGLQTSQVYSIGHPQPFQAYCVMDTADGGWTVIQRRQDGSVPFDKQWAEYEQGFGNTSGEYWLGLENIHSLTTHKQNELYVYLEDWEMNSRFARYSTFSVGDASRNYTATIDGYSGDATDSLDPSTTRHSINNRQFSTTDQDNAGASVNCANTFGQGGWWYTPSCGWGLLNGEYLTGCSVPAPGTCSSANGIVWNSWRGYRYSLKKSTMMIRPDNVAVSLYRPCQNGGTLTPGPDDSGLYICACAGGWNGAFCEKECGHCYLGQTCNRFDGIRTCPTGGTYVCTTGFHGAQCDQECSGAYGPDCTISCGHCYGNQACDRFNGRCPTGGDHVCEAGYHGDNCHQECSNTYGPDCGTTCGHCYQGQTCDRFDGTCPTGGTHVCAAGYHGDNCHQECSTGAYGPDCPTPCGHCYGGLTCDRVNGNCPTGGSHLCAAGYQGDNCKQDCSTGAYGPDCGTSCGHCYQGQACDRFDGTCPTGGSYICEKGYDGDNCHQECSGTYGHDCGTNCGHCYQGQPCDRFNGTCPTGGTHVCAAGYQGDNCHQECSGTYGPDCGTTCGHCYQGQTCDRFDGTCPTGGTHVCAAGYHGDNCHQECSGTYGPDCGTTCGHCYQGQTCDRFDGTCPTGGTHVCAAGYHGDNCHQACSGSYGHDCDTTCGHCYQGQSCNGVNGACPTGGAFVCTAGYHGNNCHQECDDGYYGNDCLESCGNCADAVCEKTDGSCPECEDPWVGDTCKMILATVSDDPESVTLVVENEATFSCTGRGVPRPTVVWYHDNNVITPGDGIRIDVTDGGMVEEQHEIHSTLTITSARRQDNGQYVCISSNVAGNDTSQEATLVVQERPDDVTVNVTTVNSTTLHVTWSVGVTGNLDIIDSQVRYKRSDTEDWGDWESTGVSDENGDVYIYGLRPAVEYDVQVQVNNSLGWSDGDGGMGTTDEAPPGPPRDLQAVPSSHSSVQLTWEPPLETNGEIINYTVQYGASDSCDATAFPHQITTSDDSTTAIIGDLVPYTNYTFRVRGATSSGGGDFSDCNITRTLEYYPTAPVIQTVADQHDCNCQTPNIPRPVQLHVAWRRPDHIHGQLQAYRVSLYNRTGGEPFYQENVTSGLQQENLTAVVTSSHLQPANNYSVTISAINTFYHGDESHPYEVRTSDGCPDAPTVTWMADGECGVNWAGPTETRGRLTGYNVTYTDTPLHDPDVSEPRVSYNTTGLDQHQWSKSLDDLPANSLVRVTVRAVTCAAGDKGQEFTCNVTRFEKPPPIVLPTGPTPNATVTSFPMVLPMVSERNGPVRCCQIIVITMNEDESLADLETRVGEPDVMLTEDAPADGKTQPYVALSLSKEDYKSTKEVLIGDGGPCGHEWCCERSELDDPSLAKNPGNVKLRSGETYTAAVRCYVDSGARRRKRNTERSFTTSGYIKPVRTEERVPVEQAIMPMVLGAIAGVCVVGLVAVAIFFYRRRAASKKDAPDIGLSDLARIRNKREDEDEEELQGAVGPAAGHVEEVIVKPQKRRSGKKPKSPSFREPIPLPDLEAEFDRRTANDNQIFAEEYSALPGTLGKEQAEAYHSDFNTTKNRFKNIITYDSGRVKLTPIPGVAGSDYISASYMDGYNTPRKYIAAQGPLPNTVDDFWRMIWDTKAKNIVMVTNLKENNKQKCTQYWPDSGKKIYGDIDVTLVDTIPMVDHVTRIFMVGKEGAPAKREVTQFHFLGWPDFGLPRSPMGLLKFRRAVVTKVAPKDMPIVVHCSAGVGRTGTFITVDAMLEMMQAEEKVDVFGFVSRMRENRSTMVQTKAQYVFIYRALLEQHLYGDTEVEVANIQHYMHKLRTEKPGVDKTGFEIEFGNLTRLPVDRANMRAGNLPENISKNRVLMILPYDTSRVFLQHKAGVKGSDYINASFIDGYREKDVYIATQGPLDRTVEDFWRMVWEWNSCSIVMLTELKEKARNKCTIYWPETGQKTFGEVVVSAQGVDSFGDYDLRTFTVTHATEGKPRTVQQFHFHGWPEVGIPDNAAGMIDLIGQVQKQQQQSGNGPITVHCSSGSGRTGTFCAISTVLERVKAEGICDVFQVVKALRQQRPHMVQTLDQYQFCYQAVVEYLDSFDHYANFR